MNDHDQGPEQSMDEADEANGEGRDDTSEQTTNDTEQRYGDDESPA